MASVSFTADSIELHATRSSVETEPVRFKYIKSLDGLRAIAVMFVVFYHAILVLPSLEPYLSGGFLGVDIFFVLSGFLISSILLDEYHKTHTVDLRNFYTRRFLRLMPAYWLQLTILYLFTDRFFTKALSDATYANNNFLYAFFYLTNWHRAYHGSFIAGLLNHTWSLAIEEQFYLVWAGLILLMMRGMTRKRIMIATLMFVGLAVWYRVFKWYGRGSVDLLYNSFISRMDALLIGCLASQVLTWRILPEAFLRSRWLDVAGISAAFVAIGIMFNLKETYFSSFLYLGGFTVFAIAVAVVIIWIANRRKGVGNKILECGPMVWIGKTSYGIYLWHSIAFAYIHQIEATPKFKLLAALALTLSLTAISYYALELPFLKLKKRFHGSRVLTTS
jgi:peptidoglycan/LPS O-acetylase OafA/YrhL